MEITSTTNVSHPERWFSVVAGTALAAYGLTRRSVAGLVISGLGGAMVWRGATGHCMVYEALGLSSARPEGDDDRKGSVPPGTGLRPAPSGTVNRPPDELSPFWPHFGNR